MKLFMTLLTVFIPLFAEIIPHPLHTGAHETVSRLRILDSVELRFDPKKGTPFRGISDLAWDGAKKRLYAVSDEGRLFTFRISLSGNRIKDLRLLDAVVLRDRKGEALKGKKRSDAEGLALSPEGLLVSFERKPRIVRYDPEGNYLGTVKLPKPLRKKSRYAGKNSMLESVAWHPRYGVVTAPERPLKKSDETRHTVYAGKHRWTLPAFGALTAIEVTADGGLLLLERGFDRFSRRRALRLTLLHPDRCRGDRCETETVALLKSGNGWRLDNFEGLTRIGKNRYLMVSDDNGNPLQKTLLVYFEITE